MIFWSQRAAIGRGDFFIRQGARREHSLSYATDDQRSLMEKPPHNGKVIYDTLPSSQSKNI